MSLYRERVRMEREKDARIAEMEAALKAIANLDCTLGDFFWIDDTGQDAVDVCQAIARKALGR